MPVYDCYLCMLDKLMKWVFRNVCPTLAASLEPLEHHQNLASLSLFYIIILLKIHIKWLNWFPLFLRK